MLDAFVQIVRKEGWLALYTGMSTMYFKEALKTFVYIYWYEKLKKLAVRRALEAKQQDGDTESWESEDDDEEEQERKSAEAVAKLGIAVSLVIGCAAGVVTQLMVNPINVVHTRITTSSVVKGAGGHDGGVVGTFLHIWKNEGLGGLYKGIGASLVLTSNPAIQYVIFDRLKSLVQARAGGRSLEPIEAFLAGVVSKLVATFVTYPYIMAKVRIQAASKTGRVGGTYAVWRHVVRNEGWLALYSGLRPQLLKSVLSAALMYVAKERIQGTVRALLNALKSEPEEEPEVL